MQKNVWHIFSTLSLGGPQRRFADYLARSKAQNLTHHVYAMDGRYEALDLVPGQQPLFDGGRVVPKGNTFAALKKCRQLLKTHRPNLLITYNWGATEWALANSFFPICPTLHIQDGFTDDEQNRELTGRRLMRMLSYRNCAKIIVPSRNLEKQVLTNWRVSEKRLTFIPNGIDTEHFNQPLDANFIEKYGVNNTGKTIGTVAALRTEKNIGRLIEAFSLVEDKHPDSQLVIVGDGVGMSALKMLANRVCSKDRVIFTGTLSNPEKILPVFNVFALSSDTEQMPLSVLEAMAAGLPVVSTDVGDIKQMVCEENAPYIKAHSAKILAKNISALLDEPEQAQNMGGKNKEKAHATYDIVQMVNAYDHLFTAHAL